MCLRNTMSDGNLYNRMFLKIYKKLLDEVDLQKAACEFVQGSETRQKLFWKVLVFLVLADFGNLRTIDRQMCYFF